MPKFSYQSEKMQAEREVKRMVGQRVILERDIQRHDSFNERRQSKLYDSGIPKGSAFIQEQNFQVSWFS